jgi:hypothetical protein
MACEGAVTLRRPAGQEESHHQGPGIVGLAGRSPHRLERDDSPGHPSRVIPRARLQGQRRGRQRKQPRNWQEEFPEVFKEDKIKPMKGRPMKIHLAGAVKPTRVLTARQVPVHLQAAAMDTLKKVIDSGVIVP